MIPTPGILPLHQFNPRVVNIHLKRHTETAAKIENKLRGTVLPTWIEHMKGYAKGGPYRYLAEIDKR